MKKIITNMLFVFMLLNSVTVFCMLEECNQKSSQKSTDVLCEDVLRHGIFEFASPEVLLNLRLVGKDFNKWIVQDFDMVSARKYFNNYSSMRQMLLGSCNIKSEKLFVALYKKLRESKSEKIILKYPGNTLTIFTKKEVLGKISKQVKQKIKQSSDIERNLVNEEGVRALIFLSAILFSPFLLSILPSMDEVLFYFIFLYCFGFPALYFFSIPVMKSYKKRNKKKSDVLKKCLEKVEREDEKNNN